MLNAITLFSELAVKERTELLTTGTEICFQRGETLFKQGDYVEHFYIVTKGAIKVSRKTKNQELILATYGRDSFFGEIALAGEMIHPYSGSAIRHSCVYSFDKDSFWRMLGLFPSIRKVVLDYMARRTQEYNVIAQSHDKFVALGTVAAGLAHELNNPASAAQRAVSQLQSTSTERYGKLFNSIQQHLNPQQIKVFQELQYKTLLYANGSVCSDCRPDPIAQMDLEDRLTAWLENQGFSNAWKLASTLLFADITPQQLEAIGVGIEPAVFKELVNLLEAMLTEASLLNILSHGVKRISELIDTVKSYAYLDRAMAKQNSIDVHQGIESTLTILSYKLKKNQIIVERNYSERLPYVCGNGAALNQVWSNLIDNAIDAVSHRGKISIRTSKIKDHVMVEIIDNGKGIPPEVQKRIFEPFFTTKEVGRGTGIGLSTVFRVVVVEHQGDIRCFSQPGETCFRVCLPVGDGAICRE
ncbi:MAG: ATP-binding protein [Cyanobacteria bacterium P01_C01_bin.72]